MIKNSLGLSLRLFITVAFLLIAWPANSAFPPQQLELPGQNEGAWGRFTSVPNNGRNPATLESLKQECVTSLNTATMNYYVPTWRYIFEYSGEYWQQFLPTNPNVPPNYPVCTVRTGTSCPSGYGAIYPGGGQLNYCRSFAQLCPANSTASGGQCVCNTGFTEVRFGTSAGACVKQPPTKNNGQCGEGNPCDPATGIKTQRESIYRAAGGGVLNFVLTYNSRRVDDIIPISKGPFGKAWTSSYDLQLKILSNGGVTAKRADGKEWSYHPPSSGLLYLADADIVDRLVRTVDASNNTTGWQLTNSNDEIETYDVSGKLLTVRGRSQITKTMVYSTASTPISIAPYAGLLIQVYDSYGTTLNFEYTSNGAVAKMIAPAGEEYLFEYNGASGGCSTPGANVYCSAGNLTKITLPDSTLRTYHYNESARINNGLPCLNLSAGLPNSLTGITDEAGQRFSEYSYDCQGRAVATQHANGAQRYEFEYQTDSTTVVDPLSTERTYSFETILGVPRNVGISSACEHCRSNWQSATYDARGALASKTDFSGNVTCYAHDSARLLEQVRGEGLLSCPANLATWTPASGTTQRKITTSWHTTYRLPMQIDAADRRTTYTYDLHGNVLTKTILDTATSESRTWTYTYNSYGQALTADGPRTDVSDVTTYTYYSCTTGYECGQIETITNALGHVTTYNTYNAHGQPLTVTDSNGVVTTLTYDLRQRLTSRTVGTEQTTFTYWPTGLLKMVTLPDGSYLEYSYDAAHRLTGLTDAEGNRIAYTLDAMGNRIAEQLYDPSNTLMQTRTRVFNTLNRLWKEIGAAGTANVTTIFGYDNNGNQTSIAAPLGRTTGQSYDELNRLTQVTDPLSGITQYGYNALDQLISVTDPRSKVTSYTYNALGDLTQQVSPDTGTTSNTFDSGGNLATSTDARSKAGTYSYDALNRPLSLTYADQTIGYSYDSGTNQKGRLTQLTDGSGSTSWSYDLHGRVLTRQQTMGAVTKTLSHSYDTSGRLQTLTLPSGNTITYGYSNGKVSSLTLDGSTTILSNVLYQPFGPTLGWTWGNSTFAVREYDQDGKLTDWDSAGLKNYSYDDAFRITGIADATDPALSQSYGYDLLDRLTSASGTSLNQSWTYDANGNRLTQGGSQASTYTVSSTNNRLSAITGALTRTYSYDAAGNVTSDGTATFTYNDASRMVSATKVGVTTTYAINALGQRVRKTTASASTYFVYDEMGHLLGEYDSAGVPVQETVWFENIPVAVLKPNGSGGVNVFYIHTDHLNTPRRISRPSDNAIVWRWDSDPFGTSAANEDPDGDSTLFAYNLRFPGQYYDTETDLHYNYFRDYDPTTGRYVQSDPIGIEDDLNTYAYVHSNPLSDVDPLGLGRATGLPERHSGMACGSGWSFTLVWEGYRGSVSFTNACRRHDKCYDTCGSSRSQCDRQFREDVLSECWKAHARLGTRLMGDCFRRANFMANVVDDLGEGPFRQAQSKCRCSQ